MMSVIVGSLVILSPSVGWLHRFGCRLVGQPAFDLGDGFRSDVAPAVDRTVFDCTADHGRVE